MPDKACTHIQSLASFKFANAYECSECVKQKSHWLHLRTCQTCGVTLCCDSSPNQHMTKHYHSTSHPVIISAEPGEKWLWCYKDELFIEYD